MTTLTVESIQNHFQSIEHQIIYGDPYLGMITHHGMITSATWMGIEFIWEPKARKNGGTIKRGHAYGNIHYFYNGQELTRDEAKQEVAKPPALRQALIEANTMIECSMCGLLIVGKEAMNPYQSFAGITRDGKALHKKRWGIVFWKRGDNDEPIYLSFCPDCLQRVANGEFRDNEGKK